MAYSWDKSLETGNPSIDSQHKSLINAINELLDACSQGKGRNEVSKTLNFLQDYVIKHFADEEMLQLKSSYPDYKVHKEKHEAFKVTVKNIADEFKENGATIQLVAKVNSSVGGWLINHIKSEDKKVAAHIMYK
ncbi:bacteriohemerythrin [Sedimentibacter sp. B4]|uniref:bacteriohemerythrin n=1 Tax=Sedimentibacter sp. B4 TaxID=304766 RepID=UPI0002F78B2B|nr:hemerythrin family protein [Sedimentibacter sp. B4]